MDNIFIFITHLEGFGSYLIVFTVLLACGLGLPIPEDIPLIASGYLSWQGTMSWPIAFTVCMIGILLGDSILFYIGRRLGEKVLDESNPSSFFKPKKVRKARHYFEKYGDKIVFFARFVAGIRAIVFFIAGSLNMPYRRFLLFDALAALLSVPIWIALGYALGHYFGSEIDNILEQIAHFKLIALGVLSALLIAVIGSLVVKYYRAKRTL